MSICHVNGSEKFEESRIKSVTGKGTEEKKTENNAAQVYNIEKLNFPSFSIYLPRYFVFFFSFSFLYEFKIPFIHKSHLIHYVFDLLCISMSFILCCCYFFLFFCCFFFVLVKLFKFPSWQTFTDTSKLNCCCCWWFLYRLC